ncbi:MAG: PKD domain-containing protein, partial [Flavobacteriales bacterium]|nr:PKD domain-containing protein [Flavobacteriales bacterium]
FTNQSSDAQSYLWDFDDGLTSTQTDPSHIFYGTGSYKVTLFAFDSVLNVDSFTITIQAPSALPFFTLPGEACPNQTVEFAVFGNYDADNIVEWDFDDGNGGSNSLTHHVFQDTGVYNVVLSVINAACGLAEDSNIIVITNTVVPTIHIHPELANTTICPGASFPFFYDEEYAIQWDFGTGDVSTDPYPSYVYDSIGVYTVNIAVTNTCGNTSSVDTTITVSQSAQVSAEAFGSYSVCKNDSAPFFAASGSGYKYQWNFGTGDIDSSEHTNYAFSDTGTYNVQLIVENLCGVTDTDYIQVNVSDSLLPIGWIAMSTTVACPNEVIQFSATSGYDDYTWDFGDGSTSPNQNPMHSYNLPGVYPVTLNITNNCGSTIYPDTVTVDLTNITPASFSTDQLNYCVGDMVAFAGNASTGILSHWWNFGDGSGDSTLNTTHNYQDTGVFIVTYVVMNSCGIKDTSILTVLIDSSGPPVSAFISSLNYACPGSSIEFTNLSSDTNSVLWYFGDGDSSGTVDPMHTYDNPGNYVVNLSVTNICGKSSMFSSIITMSYYNQLSDPVMNCSQLADSIVFFWPAVSGATGYEISSDNGVTWNSNSGFGPTHMVIGVADSSYSLRARALGQGDCLYGVVSNETTCTFIGAGLSNIASNSVTITPNPSVGIFYYSGSPSGVNADLTIYNTMGEIVLAVKLTESESLIDLSDQSAGVYLFKVQSTDHIEIHRLVVNR